LVAKIRESERAIAGDVIEKYLAGQTSASQYWPDDAELREDLGALLGACPSNAKTGLSRTKNQ